MYLIYNTFTKDIDQCDYRKDALEQYAETKAWLHDQRQYGHTVYLMSSDQSDVIKEDVS